MRIEIMTMNRSPVYATKVNNYYQVVTEETLYLGDITFSSLTDGFLEAIRLYNRNAKRNIAYPSFIFRGSVYWVEISYETSKTGKGYTQYWTLGRVKSKWVKVDMGMAIVIDRGGANVDNYIMTIPKSKVNLPDAIRYVEVN